MRNADELRNESFLLLCRVTEPANGRGQREASLNRFHQHVDRLFRLCVNFELSVCVTVNATSFRLFDEATISCYKNAIEQAKSSESVDYVAISFFTRSYPSLVGRPVNW